MMKKYEWYVVYNPELDFHSSYITVKKLALRYKAPEK
jgi:hypothetical protein